jgi:hypothetical protein
MNRPWRIFAAALLVALYGFISPLIDASARKNPAVQAASVLKVANPVGDTKDGSDTVDAFHSAASNLNCYSFNYAMTSFKDKSPTLETGTFYFKKPHMMKIRITAGPKKGSEAVLGPDGKVRGHLGGALSFFKATLSPDSDMLRSGNGYPMVDSDFLSLVDYLKGMLKKGDRSRVTVQPVAVDSLPKKVLVLDMYRSGASGDEVLKRIFLDPDTHLPLLWHDFAAGVMYSESSWSDIKPNLDLPDSFFKL